MATQRIRICRDKQGMIRIEGVPVCRVLPNGELEFRDKDRIRSAARGSDCVRITIGELREAIVAAIETGGCEA